MSKQKPQDQKIRQSDIAANIVPARPEAKQVEATTKTIYYGTGGQPQTAESVGTFAKEVWATGKSPRFWAKRDAYGHLHNPYGMDADIKRLQRPTRVPLKFVEVSQSVFTLYISFLKTRNVAYLKNAERARI